MGHHRLCTEGVLGRDRFLRNVLIAIGNSADAALMPEAERHLADPSPLVRGAAASYASAGIRVNAVAPGIMDTPASAAIIGSELAREAAARQYPLPGIGSTDELADLMAWLLSAPAARVTGQVWSMDAGFSTIRPLVK